MCASVASSLAFRGASRAAGELKTPCSDLEFITVMDETLMHSIQHPLLGETTNSQSTPCITSSSSS